MSWPTQFVGDLPEVLPITSTATNVDEAFVEGYQAGANLISQYLYDYWGTTTGKINFRDQKLRERLDWINDILLDNQPQPPEGKSADE